jgi:hypothetical protein
MTGNRVYALVADATHNNVVVLMKRTSIAARHVTYASETFHANTRNAVAKLEEAYVRTLTRGKMNKVCVSWSILAWGVAGKKKSASLTTKTLI